MAFLATAQKMVIYCAWALGAFMALHREHLKCLGCAGQESEALHFQKT